MKEIEDTTNGCLQFRAKDNNDLAWVHIKSEQPLCFATAGYRGPRININKHQSKFGEHHLNLKVDKCFPIVNGAVNNHVVVHELLHVLGFVHEHQRPDRDEIITIDWMKIKVITRLWLRNDHPYRIKRLKLKRGQIF